MYDGFRIIRNSRGRISPWTGNKYNYIRLFHSAELPSCSRPRCTGCPNVKPTTRFPLTEKHVPNKNLQEGVGGGDITNLCDHASESSLFFFFFKWNCIFLSSQSCSWRQGLNNVGDSRSFKDIQGNSRLFVVQGHSTLLKAYPRWVCRDCSISTMYEAVRTLKVILKSRKRDHTDKIHFNPLETSLWASFETLFSIAKRNIARSGSYGTPCIHISFYRIHFTQACFD